MSRGFRTSRNTALHGTLSPIYCPSGRIVGARKAKAKLEVLLPTMRVYGLYIPRSLVRSNTYLLSYITLPLPFPDDFILTLSQSIAIMIMITIRLSSLKGPRKPVSSLDMAVAIAPPQPQCAEHRAVKCPHLASFPRGSLWSALLTPSPTKPVS